MTEATRSLLRWDNDVRNDAATQAVASAEAGQVSRAAATDLIVGGQSRVAVSRRQEVPCAGAASSTTTTAANRVGVVGGGKVDDAPRTDAGAAVQCSKLRTMSDAVWR